jgi:type 1 glutamine amidotransferase
MDATRRSVVMNRRVALGLVAATAVGGVAGSSASGPSAKSRILILVGPSDHPPGTHEVLAGGRLLRHCLDEIGTAVGLTAELRTAWPGTPAELDGVIGIVMIGDVFPPEVMPERAGVMDQLKQLMEKGCGLVCLHYATGLESRHVGPDGSHPLLDWIGGYFATRCKHHQSVARVYAKATINLPEKRHPTSGGWKAFTIHDEPYTNIYFGRPDRRARVTPLATAQLPPEKPATEVVAWAVERPDGGRGAGIAMPHFFKNWAVDDLRTLVLNTIVWSAGKPVPEQGFQVKLPALETFGPVAVTPGSQPKRPSAPYPN